MKLFTLAIILVFLNTIDLFAQNPYSVKGSVLDTASGVALLNTSIVVLNSKDSTLVKYGRAAANGSFSLSNLRAGQFILLVSYPDYADYAETFSLDSLKPSHDFGKIKMILKARLLEEVIVKGKAAQITIKGDTTEFNAAAFTIEPNSKVEDLLKQLPGIQVDQNGKITAQGATVNKVLVDGEEFFGDDPTLVTRNVRGDMVDKVQLYDKKSDQATFTGIDDGERTKTLNIKLKEDKKQGYFGKADAGGGNDDYYQGQAMFNYFKGKKKIAAYGTVANTAKTGLSWEENSKYGSSNVQIMDNGEITLSGGGGNDELESFNGRFNGQGIPLTHSGGIHYDTKWSEDKYSINMNYKAGSIDISGNNNARNQNNLPTGIINSNSDRNFDSYMFRQKMDATLTVKLDTTSNLKISVDGTLKNSQSKNTYTAISQRGNGTALNGSERSLSNEGDQQLFNATAFWTKKLKKKGRTVSLSLGQTLNEDDTDGYLNSENSFFNIQGALDSTQLIDQYKTNLTRTSGFNSNMTYTEPLSKAFSLVLNYGLNLSTSHSERNSYNQSVPGKYDVLDVQFSNDFELKQTSNQAGAIFNYRKDKNVLNFGTRVSIVDFKQTDLNTNKKYNTDFMNWLPQVYFQHDFSKQKSFGIRYNGNSSQPSLSQIQPLRVNNDPLNIDLGNPDLNPSFQSSFNAYYRSYKLLSDKSVSFNGFYTFTSNAIVRNTVTDDAGKSTVQSVNLTSNHPSSYWLNANLGQKIPNTEINIQFGVLIAGNTIFNLMNNTLNKIQNNHYSPSISVRQNKPKKFSYSFRIGPAYNQNESTLESSVQNGIKNNGWSVNSNLNFSIDLPGKVKILSDVVYHYTQKMQSFNENFNRMVWNTSLSKSFLKDNALQFVLSGNDVLNQNEGFSRSPNTQNRYTTIKRYFMISAVYDLSRMGGPQPSKN